MSNERTTIDRDRPFQNVDCGGDVTFILEHHR